MWLDCATLNCILGEAFLLLCLFLRREGIVPLTWLPTLNWPNNISISINFGTQNLLISTPSKKAYTLSYGLNSLPVNIISLDLIKLIISLLTTLLPKEDVSIVSTMDCCVPLLCWLREIPPLAVILLTIESLGSNICWLPTLIPDNNPWTAALFELPLLFCKVCWLLDRPRSILTPTVSQEFHSTGVTPILIPSAPSVTSAPIAEATAANEPSIITSFGCILVTSIQISVSGSNSIDPSQNITRKGVTFSTLVA